MLQLQLVFLFHLACLHLACLATTALSTSDVSLKINQDSLNSAGKVYFNAGVLKYGPAKATIHGKIQTTDIFKTLLPKAYNICPSCPLEFVVQATSAPSVAITSTGGAVVSVRDAQLYMNANTDNLLVLDLNASLGLNFSSVPKSSGEFLTAKISILQLHTIVQTSNVGILANVVIALIDPIIQSILNDAAGVFNTLFPGLPLPSIPQAAVSNVLITTNAGYIGVGLDITPKYVPPPSKPCVNSGTHCDDNEDCCNTLVCGGNCSANAVCMAPKPLCSKIADLCQNNTQGLECCPISPEGQKMYCKVRSGKPHNKTGVCAMVPPPPKPLPCIKLGDFCNRDPGANPICCAGSTCEKVAGTSYIACQRNHDAGALNMNTNNNSQEERASFLTSLVSRSLLSSLPSPFSFTINNDNVDAPLANTNTSIRSNPPGFSGPGIISKIGGQGLTKILNVVVSEIVAFVNTIDIPEMSCYLDSCGIGGGKHPIQYDIKGFKIRGFKIGVSTIKFIEGKGLAVTLGGLYFNLPNTNFEVKKYVFPTKLHCSGHFSGSLNGLSLVETVDITSNSAGQPSATGTSNWDWGAGLKVDVGLVRVCKFIEDIAEWFIGNINNLLIKKIKEVLPKALDGLISNNLNALLQGLVLKKEIDEHATITFYLTDSPNFSDDTLTLDLSGQVIKT